VAGLTDFDLLEEPVDENTQLVALQGEVDAVSAPQLGKRLLGLAEEGKKGVVVDMTGVTFMDSTGIGVILNALRALTSRDSQLVLVCPTERVLRPFRITGLIGRLPIAASREEALASLDGA
jgi:anti-sigma B factor antagonist